MRPGVFLDRDGVLNERPPEHEYVRSVDAFELLPGVEAALRRLSAAGFVLVVVSNQRGIARGLVTWETLREIEDVIANRSGVAVQFRYCPHDGAAQCACRKPQPGLLVEAMLEFDIDRSRSFMVGDMPSDVEAGRRAGVRTILVGAVGSDRFADAQAADLAEAAGLILGWDAPEADVADAVEPCSPRR
jgi:D-glycero-D-manno-heptose 1,7-bisphosphate phosphatase